MGETGDDANEDDDDEDDEAMTNEPDFDYPVRPFVMLSWGFNVFLAGWTTPWSVRHLRCPRRSSVCDIPISLYLLPIVFSSA